MYGHLAPFSEWAMFWTFSTIRCKTVFPQLLLIKNFKKNVLRNTQPKSYQNHKNRLSNQNTETTRNILNHLLSTNIIIFHSSYQTYFSKWIPTETIQKLKGETCPYLPTTDRKLIIAAVKILLTVKSFQTEFLIRKLKTSDFYGERRLFIFTMNSYS